MYGNKIEYFFSFSGRTYFFKDHFFWLFNDKKMAVDEIGPKLITAFWFNCEKNNSIPIPKPGSHDSKNNIYDQLYGTGYNSADNFVSKFTFILTSFLFILVRVHVWFVISQKKYLVIKLMLIGNNLFKSWFIQGLFDE